MRAAVIFMLFSVTGIQQVNFTPLYAGITLVVTIYLTPTFPRLYLSSDRTCQVLAPFRALRTFCPVATTYAIFIVQTHET